MKLLTPSRSASRSVTRRDVLNGAIAGAVALSLPRTSRGLILPGGAASSVGQPFDYYISTTGSDANPGTLASPWAITAINTKQSTYAGLRVGLLPGTYDVSSLMTTDAQNSARTPALNINGGTTTGSVTYIGSSDSSGHYFPRTATIQAPSQAADTTNAMMGCNSQVVNPKNWTVDGLVFSGFTLWAFHISDSPSGLVTVTNWTIKNCEFTGMQGWVPTNASGVNIAPLVIYAAANGFLTNNYFYNNSNWSGTTFGTSDASHFSCVYSFGYASGTHDNEYTYNTLVNSGNFHGKEATQYNHEIAYNYIDMTSSVATDIYCAAPVFGYMADSANAGATGTSIHHNVCLHQGCGLSVQNDNPTASYVDSPCAIYNNTLVQVGNETAGGDVALNGYEGASNSHHVSAYNNLVYDNGQPALTYGYWLANSDFFALCDYNIYGTQTKYTTVPAGANSDGSVTTLTSLSAWGTAIGGLEVHSSTSSVNPFTSGGTYAKAYQVASGSPAYQAGRVGGTSGGGVCNVGAWDGTVTQIGADWVV